MGQMGLTQASDDTTPEGNESNAINIIWIDAKVENEENTSYLKSLEGIANTKISCYKNIDDAVVFIKRLKFSETNIIISGRLYADFIQRLKDILGDIFIIPKIIVFTSNKEEFLKYNKDFDEKKNTFYNFGGIKTSFDEIKDFLMKPTVVEEKNEKNKNLENNLTFEYIDCKEKLVLPLLYKSLIENASKENMEEYTKYIYNKYGTNEEIDKLLNSIKYIKDIPIQLLSKYYTRLYTIESQFYYDINKELRGNDKDKYLSYIKILYEGVKLKSLPLASNNILYRGSLISDEEIKKIKEYLSVKKPDLPGAIVFAKTFFSFSKDKKIAEKYIKKENKNEKLKKVLYILEKDDKIDYSLSTHSDMENISIYPYEKEVLFFPFSSFEIKEINEKIVDEENIYEIKLKYLGKYLKEINDLDENIPNDSEFKKQMIDIGLIPDKKLEKSKEIIQHYQEYKENVDQIIDKSNEIEIKYIVNGKNEIRIFGNEFVVNNRDKCKIVFKGKEHDLVEHFKIPDYTDENEKLTELVIKLRYIKNITDLSCMFHWCSALISISDLYKLDLECIHPTSYMFSECSSLRSLPNISNWNTINITNMSYMFHKCSSLNSLPDISKWNTKNVSDMSKMFYNCSSLDELPDLSNWNTINVVNMEGMFSWCKSLISLPNISYWNTNNVSNMSNLFNGCQSLTSLPDISKWNLSKVTNMNEMFKNCNKNLNIPSKFIK